MAILLDIDLLVAMHYHRDHFDIDAMPQLMANNDLGFVFERSENMKQCVVLPLHE